MKNFIEDATKAYIISYNTAMEMTRLTINPDEIPVSGVNRYSKEYSKVESHATDTLGKYGYKNS